MQQFVPVGSRTRTWWGRRTAEVFLAVIGTAHAYRADLGSVVCWLYGRRTNVVPDERRRLAQRALREHPTPPAVTGRAVAPEVAP